jgi:hypothetical protein
MPRFDTEELLKASAAKMKEKLNDEIACIATEKNVTIPAVNDGAWYFQNLSDEAFSYPTFVVWGMYDNPVQTDTQENNAIKQVKIFFEVCLPDEGGPISQNVFYKLLRYTRALEQVVDKNFDKIRSGTKVKVDSLSPTSFDLGGKVFRSAGILISAHISRN